MLCDCGYHTDPHAAALCHCLLQPQEMAFGAAAANGSLGRPAGVKVEEAPPIPADLAAHVPRIARALLGGEHSVARLGTLRKFIESYRMDPEVGVAVRTASDPALHAALVAGDQVVCIRSQYVERHQGEPSADAVRGVIIELLQEREQLKRSELLAAIKAKGLSIADNM